MRHILSGYGVWCSYNVRLVHWIRHDRARNNVPCLTSLSYGTNKNRPEQAWIGLFHPHPLNKSVLYQDTLKIKHNTFLKHQMHIAIYNFYLFLKFYIFYFITQVMSYLVSSYVLSSSVVLSCKTLNSYLVKSCPGQFQVMSSSVLQNAEQLSYQVMPCPISSHPVLSYKMLYGYPVKSLTVLSCLVPNTTLGNAKCHSVR